MNNSKPEISISLNPSYFCSERCSFCYLTEEQLSDKSRLDLDVLSKRLEEISEKYTIVHIDLYGGEPALLPRPYVDSLKIILQQYVDCVNVNTNFITIPSWFHDEFWYICVSYDGTAREHHSEVEVNILSFDRDISILSLASPSMMKQVDYIVGFVNMASNVVSWEIKPYSSNQSNDLELRYTDFEDCILEALDAIESTLAKGGRKIIFTNEDLIEQALGGKRNAFSNDHVYITPNGKLGVLEFDEDECEFFLELDTIDDYKKWTELENARVSQNPTCSQCTYFGKCLTEHYRKVDDLNNSCNGFYYLLQEFD